MPNFVNPVSQHLNARSRDLTAASMAYFVASLTSDDKPSPDDSVLYTSEIFYLHVPPLWKLDPHCQYENISPPNFGQLASSSSHAGSS